jgi:hypothetical protein
MSNKLIVFIIMSISTCSCGTICRDMTGHPRDIPDAGAYEYRASTKLLDLQYYIFNNWLSKTGKGDFNHDGICNFIDFTILSDWWDNPSKTNYQSNLDIILFKSEYLGPIYVNETSI